MKQHFISITLRNQFNLFYRFGYIFIPKSSLKNIPKSSLKKFNGVNLDSVKEKVIELFSQLTPFEYDEEYLILHLEKNITRITNNNEFNIQDLVAVYPLSQQAKASIESKMDTRIRLEQPIFESILPQIESKIEEKEIEKAIDALWHICHIEGVWKEYFDNIGRENIFKGLEYRKKGVKTQDIESGNYWEYLIAYDRYDYFPKTTLGYFYDAGQVFAYYKGKPTFKGSNLYQLLERLKPDTQLKKIIENLEKAEDAKKYISQTSENIKQYEVAPIYLMLRNEIREADDIKQTKVVENLNYLLEFGDTFKYVVILLGAFFGFRKFYDIYYESLNLKFYKNYKDDMRAMEIIYKALQDKEDGMELTTLASLIKKETNESGRQKTKEKIKKIIKAMNDSSRYKTIQLDKNKATINKDNSSLFQTAATTCTCV